MGPLSPVLPTPVEGEAATPESNPGDPSAGLWARVVDDQSHIAIDLSQVEALVVYVLKAEGCSRGGVEVAFVDDDTIARLHEQFMDIAGATDVITFPMHDPEDPECSLGEVVVSTETAIRQAPEFGLDPRDEALLYVVHGVLHILGYDDLETAERDEMTERQWQLLADWKQGHG